MSSHHSSDNEDVSDDETSGSTMMNLFASYYGIEAPKEIDDENEEDEDDRIKIDAKDNFRRIDHIEFNPDYYVKVRIRLTFTNKNYSWCNRVYFCNLLSKYFLIKTRILYRKSK